MIEHPLRPDGGSAAWTKAPDVSACTTTSADLPAAARRELHAAIDGHADGRPESLTRYLRAQLGAGPGFVRLRSSLGGAAMLDRCAALLDWLMPGFGRVLAQNTKNDTLYEVTDRSDARGFYGGSRGTDALRDHTDQAAAPEDVLPELLVLMCVQPATSGGESVLTSGYALHDALWETNSAHVSTLYEPLPFARPADGTADAAVVWSPVFRRTEGGLRVRYNRYFVELGAAEADMELDERQLAALDAAEAFLARPASRVIVPLAAGDVLLVDNTAILHNRLAYVDTPEPEGRRRLLRGWVRRDHTTRAKGGDR